FHFDWFKSPGKTVQGVRESTAGLPVPHRPVNGRVGFVIERLGGPSSGDDFKITVFRARLKNNERYSELRVNRLNGFNTNRCDIGSGSQAASELKMSFCKVIGPAQHLNLIS